MITSMSAAVSRGPRLTARACLAALLTLPAALMLVAVGQAPARSATLGTLAVTPATGTVSTLSTFTTSGLCLDGDGLTVKVYGGSGTGSVIAVPTSQLSPKNMNGAVDAAGYVDGAVMTIPASQTWRDFASTGTPALSSLNGIYTVRAWCSSGDWYEGQLSFDGASGTYTTAVGPGPTTTTAAPTTTTASPTTTKPAPTTTTAAPTTTPAPTTTSAAPTTKPAPTTTTAAPTTTSAAPTTTSAAPTTSPTLTPTPLPTVTPKPGEVIGVGIDGNGAFIPAGSTIERGATVTVAASGFAPGELLKYSVFSRELVFGYGYADTAGATTYRFVVPTDLPDGSHKLVVAGATRVVVFPFVVGQPSSGTPTSTSTAAQPSGSTAASAQPSSTADAELADTGAPDAALRWGVLLSVLLLVAGAHLMLTGPRTAAPGRHTHPRRGRHAA